MTANCRRPRRFLPFDNRRSLPGLCLICAFGPHAAFAADADVPATATQPVEEVIVTARKVEESVQEIPASLLVLTAGFLDATDPAHYFDLQFNVPGLVVNNLGLNGAGFSLRGVGDQGGSSLSVTTNLNGVYLGAASLATTRLFDLERVEVLKGPQGTLYGRNASGGSINFIARAPQPEFGGEIEAAYGSFDTARVQGHVNLPFGHSALRIAGIVSEGDGFIRNSVDDRRFAEKDFRGLRAFYQADLSDRVQVDLLLQHVEDDGASGELWLPRPDFLADPSDIRLTTVTLDNPFLSTASDNVSIDFRFDFGSVTLHSISGYASNELRDVDDCAGIPILAGCVRSAMPARHRQFSQEFRLASAGDRSVDWLIGAYIYDDDTSTRYFQFTPVTNPDPTTDRFSTFAETTHALFGQAVWRPADRWSITAGLRVSNETQALVTVGDGVEDSPTPVGAKDSWNNLSWRLDLQYAVSDEVLLYSGVATGFRSGGFSIQPFGILDGYDPERLTAYEAGVKSRFLDRRLRLNGAAFYYDFHDLQVNTSTITPDGIIFETDNAARAEIYGIDLEGEWRAGQRLSFSGGVVWLPGRRFVEYRNDRTGDTLSGNDLTRSPEWTATLAIGYDQPLRQAGAWSARLEYNYRSGFFYTTDNNPLFSQDGFGLLNLFLEFEPAGDRWYVFASGRNLGKADYFNQVFLQASPGYPDTYEAGFGYRF